MRIGIVNPFAYRPHVAHMVFLDRLFERLGYERFFLGCGGDLEDCNSRITKSGVRHRMECFKCRAGSFRSYLNVPVSRLDASAQLSAADIEDGHKWAYSTACTALQVEHQSETQREDFQRAQRRLAIPTARAHANARRWIRENRLDTVFVFNGRFDLTRAVVEACLREGVRFVSVERSWFGDGLQLLPQENCLGLRNFAALCQKWAEKPLTRFQALKASGLIARRLTGASRGEWRQYNLGNNASYDRDHIKYLFLPSSQHEWIGDPDRASGWHHPIEGLECLIDRLGVNASDLVVRGHPGWAMKIKNYGENRANSFYRDWTRRVGAAYIEPSAPIDTHSLIRAADLVLLNGSSASMEAAWLGKPVVSFVPAAYSWSGISMSLFGRSHVQQLSQSALEFLKDPRSHPIDPVTQCRHALRFIYCANYRIMQFVNSMKSSNPFAFKMAEPADLTGLASLAEQGTLREDDATFAADETEENVVVTSILRRDGGSIGAEPEGAPDEQLKAPRRRAAYRLIDLLSA